jgi:hypothetical protein
MAARKRNLTGVAGKAIAAPDAAGVTVSSTCAADSGSVLPAIAADTVPVIRNTTLPNDGMGTEPGQVVFDDDTEDTYNPGVEPVEGRRVIDTATDMPRWDVYRVQGVEVFRAGKYPQGEYKPEDVQEMARTYNPLFLKAPVTPDHVQEGPAWGWVNRVYEQGGALFADFDLFPEYYCLFREGYYPRRSIEFYEAKQLPDGTKGFYVKAVSLLGAATPAVDGMANRFAEVQDKAKSIAANRPDLATHFAAQEIETFSCVNLEDNRPDTGADNSQQNNKEPDMDEVKKLSEQLSEMQKSFAEQMAAKDAQLEQLKQQAAEDRAKAEQAECAKFCDAMQTAGKMTPAEAKIFPVLFHNINHVVKFGEQDLNLRELLCTLFNERPAIVSAKPESPAHVPVKTDAEVKSYDEQLDVEARKLLAATPGISYYEAMIKAARSLAGKAE